MQLPIIRVESTSINVTGVYIPVGGLCECGAAGYTIACFRIQDGDVDAALLLCEECSQQFEAEETLAKREFVFVSVDDALAAAKRRKAENCKPKGHYKTTYNPNQEKLLSWIAQQPEPSTPYQVSEVFGGTRSLFNSLLHRWSQKGVLEKVFIDSRNRNGHPGVAYRVAEFRSK